MKIGVFFGDFSSNTGGGFTFEHDIFKTLLKTKSEHEFIILYQGNVSINEESRVKFVPVMKNLDFFYKNPFFQKIIRKFFYNFLLNKVIKDNGIELIWFLIPVYARVNIPYIYTVWDLAHRTYSCFPEVSVSGWKWEKREKLYSFAIPRASYVITGTEAGKDEVARYYGIPEERIKVIPFATPSYVFNRRQDRDDVLAKYNISHKYLFYPAQFWPHKNHIAILQALKILKEKYSLDFSAVFAGSDKGNMKYTRDRANELGLTDKVVFTGFISRDDLVGLYKKAFALVYPTYFGPDNIPPLEAFALGCPVIASNVSGAVEQLGDAALLINPGIPEEIADSVNKLNNDQDLRDLLIQKGLKRSTRFTSVDYIKSIHNIIDDFEAIRSCWSNKIAYKENR